MNAPNFSEREFWVSPTSASLAACTRSTSCSTLWSPPRWKQTRNNEESINTETAKFMGPTWGPPGACELIMTQLKPSPNWLQSFPTNRCGPGNLTAINMQQSFWKSPFVSASTAFTMSSPYTGNKPKVTFKASAFCWHCGMLTTFSSVLFRVR